MSDRPVLYLGDTALTGAGAYLAGLMTHWGWGYDYVPSDQPAQRSLFDADRQLIILSDYPASMIDTEAQQVLVEQVAQGTGLIMVGGWESFQGQGGDWAGTVVAEALPVQIATHDDRINCDQPAMVLEHQPHESITGLPWADRPPAVGGFNRVEPKPTSQVVLAVQRFDAARRAGRFEFTPGHTHPLLVVGQHSQGHTAALTTDIAPHWVGPLIDWGPDRVTAQAPGSHGVEVGNLYATFLKQLLGWVG